MAGEFIQQFFEERGFTDVKPNGEMDVLCPFPHDKGYETNPSAHVNTHKGVFHCKTCEAEDRWNDGGLSETGFVSAYYNISYSQAIKMLSTFSEVGNVVDAEVWDRAAKALPINIPLMEFLQERGITPDIVTEYRLGYLGAGIAYPVFVNGVLLDIRTYNIDPAPGEPKIKSETGASALLFPFDNWKNDERPTLLCAGENDTLLARKMGFNAITSTFGEGSFPPMFIGLFKDKEVYIAYDCDKAGREGSRRVAFLLHEAGARVKLVDLGLAGTKDDKDITDFFIKHNRTTDDLTQKLAEATPFDTEMFLQEKNVRFPLVDLWNVPDGKYSGKRISSRVMMMGKFDDVMEAPTAVEWRCNRPDPENAVCAACRLSGESGWWMLEDENMDELLELVEVDTAKQKKAIKRFIGIPAKCPGVMTSVREKKHVQKVILSPDVESEDELRGFKTAEMITYAIGTNMDDGSRYRVFFRRYPHPKNQAIVLVTDKVEESDNAINSFKVTPEMVEELSQFQGSPETVMDYRYKISKQIVDPYVPRSVVEAVNIMYHSVLDFKYAGKVMKGHPEGLIVGPSRTGKTDTAKKWQQFLGLGNLTDCKNGTTAGLLGGADKTNSGSHRIRWGKVPRNHKGLVFMDELSGLPQGVMSSLTALRSERIARLEKIVSGAAPAKTRMLWISNPRVQPDGQSKPIELYNNGVEVVLDLIGSDEDVARFDFTVILPNNEVYISPFSKEELDDVENPAFRNLVYWAWSRTADQVKFATGVEQYIWQVAQELNERYDTNIKIFGAEAHKKLARISVSVAAMCFAHDGTGESILCSKSHVDWARDFLVRCYDNSIFRLADYVEQQRLTNTTPEEVITVFTGLVNGQPLLMQTLARQSGLTLQQLQIVTGLTDRDMFGGIVSNLVLHGLIRVGKSGNVEPTMRFRKCREIYANTADKQKLTPLSQIGGLPI